MPLDSCALALLDLPAELLIRILSYLSLIDLCAVQRTCRKIRIIVADSMYLQYILLAQISGVDDHLPSDFALPERIKRLRYHEQSWNNLQLNAFHNFPSDVDHSYSLQDDYLIYNLRKSAGTLQYGYVDLRSAEPNEKLRWVNIFIEHISVPVGFVTAVDHNLVVVLRTQFTDSGAIVELSFLEFTTGTPHPLSSRHNVRLPVNTILDVAYAAVDILGDYVVTTVMSGRDVCCLYLVSWKSGAVTLLREIELLHRLTPFWVPRLVVIDNSLIMLVNCKMTSLEICRLELASPDSEPRLKTVCLLEFPVLPFYALAVSKVRKEWIPTSECNPLSQLRRKRVVPFRSSKVGTIGLLLLDQKMTCAASVRERSRYWMTISVASLLASIPPDSNDVRAIPWGDWGPAATRIFKYPHRWGNILPKPAGPFWIIGFSPLVVRDYDPLRTRRAKAKSTEEVITSHSPSLSRPPVFSPTKELGHYWVAGEVETRLPFRDVAEKNLRPQQYIGIIADREWIIEISARGQGAGTNVVVYHVG
ncbi:hypothetical protein BGW80DRAFT_58965 [Lactifluus volemus]|nr:hypothetical protein BGW80DRAFT_58965 [Lactifluus volemus]